MTEEGKKNERKLTSNGQKIVLKTRQNYGKKLLKSCQKVVKRCQKIKTGKIA
jgi:hypothetical protein